MAETHERGPSSMALGPGAEHRLAIVEKHRGGVPVIEFRGAPGDNCLTLSLGRYIPQRKVGGFAAGILRYKIRNQLEYRLIAIKYSGLPIVEDGVIVGEGVSFLILQKDAGDIAPGKGIMVAVRGQSTPVQSLEILFFAVDTLKQSEAWESLVAAFAILHRIVVADHVDIKQILDLLQRHGRVLGIELRTPQIGIFTGESDEIHVIQGLVLSVMGRQCHDCGRAGSIIVSSGIEDLFAQVAQMVVVRSENVATVVARTFNLCYHVEDFAALEELVVHICADAFGFVDGLRGNPDNGLVHHPMPVSLEKFDRGCPGIDESGIRAFTGLLQF